MRLSPAHSLVLLVSLLLFSFDPFCFVNFIDSEWLDFRSASDPGGLETNEAELCLKV